MAIIQSPTGVQQEVDTLPKASRNILYKADGTAVNPIKNDYMARIEVIPSTVLAATTFWTMRNLSGGTIKVYITKLEMKVGFSGVAAATRSIYEIVRFTTATPTGGSTLVAIKKDNAQAASVVTDIRFSAAGLTVTGAVFETPWHLIGHTNQVTIDHNQDISFDDGLVLGPGEGLAIRANTTLVAGSYLIGSIRWQER